MPNWGSFFPTLSPYPIARPEILQGPMGPAGAGSSHEKGCYYINLVTQSIQRQCNPLNAVALAPLGYFGQGYTPAAAFNAFPTFEAAQKAIEDFRNLPNQDPLKPGGSSPASGGGSGGGSGSGSGGQSDWTNLFIRLAEFGIGAILIIIGFNAIVAKTKTGQTIIRVAGATATRGATK